MKSLQNCVRTAFAAFLALIVPLNALIFPLNQSANAVEVPRLFAAQSASAPLVAPPPSQIASAHAVFLTNSASDANFPIDPTKGFNDVYAALQSWNYYKLVDAPAQADLIFQLHETAPITDVAGGRGGVHSIASPAFQLDILDPKTNISLWTITSPVNVAGKNQVRERWTSIAETNLISRIKTLAGQPLSAAETADLTTVPKNHFSRTAWIAIGAVVAAGVAGGLILHHEYENGLATQKATQDAFCEANHIPLSECAGG